MTSSRNSSSGSRKRRRSTFDRSTLRRLFVFGGAFAALGVALYAFFFLSPVRQDPQAARAAVAQSLKLLAASNLTAARDTALSAVRSDPNSADAHLALARAQLMLEDGVGAEGELRRAIEGGADARQLHHLMAHAILLQGKPEQAIDEVEKTSPQNRPYGLRIRARALTALGNFADAQASLNEAVRIAGKDAQVWTDMARFRFGAGDISGASEASQRAIALDKGNIEALVLRGRIVRAQFGLVAALPWFESALTRDPYHHDALIEYASTLGDAGRAQAMLAATRRALAARPGSPQAYYLQAVLAARAAKFDLARDLLAKTGGTIDGMPGVLLLGGTLDLEQGANEQAIEKLRQLVGMQPMNLTARRLLAQAFLRSDAARNAIDTLRPILDRADADPYTLLLAARGFERIGERGPAWQLLDRATQPTRDADGAFAADDSTAVLAGPAAQDPNNPGAVVPLIRAMLANGDKAGALARAAGIARANPGAPGAHLIFGDMLMLAGRPGDAATEYKAAATLRFDEPVLLRLVESLEKSNRRPEAAQALALFLSQNPSNISALRITAQWQLASGEYDAAVDTLEGLRARLGDRDAAIAAQLAMAYAGAGNDEAARDYGETAYLLAPSNPQAVDAYGWALFSSGDAEGALEVLRKAALLAPNHAGIKVHIAQVQAAMAKPAGQ